MLTNHKFSHGFLESLLGKEIRVYRGGPESKTGKLVAVHGDYIVLHTTDNQKHMVYYNLHHVKSISENAKANASSMKTQEEELAYVKATNFQHLFKQLLHTKIHVNQGGPESKPGYLVAAMDNYIVLYTKDDGMVYYNLAHIKSVTVKDTQKEEVAWSHHLQAKSFYELFQHMVHTWVSINRGGPEALEGILSEGTGGHYTLIYKDEVFRIYPQHIKSISNSPKGIWKNVMETAEQNQQQTENGDTEQQEENSTNTSNEQTTNQNTDNKQQGSAANNQYNSKSVSSGNSKDASSKQSNRTSYSRGTVIQSINYDWQPRRRRR